MATWYIRPLIMVEADTQEDATAQIEAALRAAELVVDDHRVEAVR